MAKVHGRELKVETLPTEAAAKAGKEGEEVSLLSNYQLSESRLPAGRQGLK